MKPKAHTEPLALRFRHALTKLGDLAKAMDYDPQVALSEAVRANQTQLALLRERVEKLKSYSQSATGVQHDEDAEKSY